MAENQEKRFYWLKLKVNFMTSETVDFLMSQKDGANYIVLYQMLCLKTINTDGRLCRTIGEVIIPFDESKIQRDCKWFSIDTIRVAMELYKKLGLIYEDTDGTLVISGHKDLIGSEGHSASRMRKLRNEEKQRCLPEVTSKSHCASHCDTIRDENVTTEIEYRDRDKEIDKSILYAPPLYDTNNVGSKRNERAGENEDYFEGVNDRERYLDGACGTGEAESCGTSGNRVDGSRLRRTEKGPLDWHDLSKDRLH